MNVYVCMVRLTCTVRGYVHFLVDSDHKNATLLVSLQSCKLVLSFNPLELFAIDISMKYLEVCIIWII